MKSLSSVTVLPRTVLNHCGFVKENAKTNFRKKIYPACGLMNLEVAAKKRKKKKRKDMIHLNNNIQIFLLISQPNVSDSCGDYYSFFKGIKKILF